MDPRYTGRPPSPRRYGQPGRSSTGRIDTYPPDYDNYHAPPRSSRDSIVPGPRSSAERVIIPRSEPRLQRNPVGRHPREDDYYVPPRRDPPLPVSRRPLSVVTSAESPNRFRPVVSSAADSVPSPYKSRAPEDEPYYVLPASSQHHHRHFSAGGEDNHRYSDPNRDRRPEKGGYRSVGPSKGSIDYSRNVPQIREPRDAQDRDYGYEYTNKKEQVYRDTEPRPRIRRGSDLGPRERPYSVIGGEDYYRQPRDSGPPVTTRGFSKIDPNGTIRHEYRVPKENDPPPRDHSLLQAGRDDRDTTRLRPPRGSVALHQDNNDGYSSNVEDRYRERHHRHKRNESLDRGGDRGVGTTRHVDERRFEERGKTHHRADSEDRHHRSHRHRDTSEDRVRPPPQVRRHDREEDDRERKYYDEPRKEKHDRDEKQEKHEKHEKHHERTQLTEGLAGAASVAAAGLVAGTIKHRKDKGADDAEDVKDGREKSRRLDRHRDEVDQANGSRSDESDEDYRERRRRRRRERDGKEKRNLEEEEVAASKEGTKLGNQERGSKPTEDRGDTDEERDRRSRRRHRRERRDSASQSDDETARRNKERSRVRVVSPPKEPEKKPRGILRPPTQKFPEDPAPIREGVAPLNVAGKKGIPPNARWTKIDRRLVNPEALELGNERYEERDDYVIVLRVLSKEDIEKYAEVTQELRNRRAGSSKEAPRAIDAHPHDHDSDEGPPLQIANAPHNPAESLPVRDRSLGSDLQPAPKPSAMAETVVNAHQQRAAANAEEDDRPSLPSGGSYHRVAPPNVQPPTSIPLYPAVNPPTSTPVNLQAPYKPPAAVANVQDPAASWHGTAGPPMAAYPAPPTQPHSQGHTPPPPIPPKEVDNYPSQSEGYQRRGGAA